MCEFVPHTQIAINVSTLLSGIAPWGWITQLSTFNNKTIYRYVSNDHFNYILFVLANTTTAISWNCPFPVPFQLIKQLSVFNIHFCIQETRDMHFPTCLWTRPCTLMAHFYDIIIRWKYKDVPWTLAKLYIQMVNLKRYSIIPCDASLRYKFIKNISPTL